MALKWSSSEFILEGSLMANESPKAHLPLKLLKLPKAPVLPCSRKTFPQLPPRTPPPAPAVCRGWGALLLHTGSWRGWEKQFYGS